MSWFVCPLDGLPLAEQANSLRCDKGHTYDRAREGYVNLLPVQFKASKDPGDNKEMVQARKRFLDAGHYAPIANKLKEIVRAEVPAGAKIVDAGCGEGYYLDALGEGYARSGFDISKWAVQAAAKRNRAIAWAVASNRQLPYAPGSLDAILCLFGFPVWPSFRQAVRAGGKVVLVDPGAQHLRELREIIYPEVRETSAPSLQAARDAGFTEAGRAELSFRFALTSQTEIQDLLAMTPHGYRMGPDGRAAVARREQLEVTGDAIIRVLAAR